ncbi:MAG: septum formation initiator family protein, partial [Bdellovibrionales bacterium]|nr:septum formation initiator family protein [Bdellovibrionales bacterium]
STLRSFLNRPLGVFWICLFIISINLVLDGTLLRFWGLKKDFIQLQKDSVQLNQEINKMTTQIKRAHDPVFVEREARDRFNLVKEKDLVFVFTDDE